MAVEWLVYGSRQFALVCFAERGVLMRCLCVYPIMFQLWVSCYFGLSIATSSAQAMRANGGPGTRRRQAVHKFMESRLDGIIDGLHTSHGTGYQNT